MIDNLFRHLRHLQKADALIGRIWLNVLAYQLGLFLFAGLIAIFGLGMTNVAGFYALQTSLGSVWAAVVVATADFALATIVILAARHRKPGAEIVLADDARKIAIDAVQADARDLKATLDAFGQDIRDTKDLIAGFVQNPLDAAVQNLLIPAATSIINGLHSKKDQA
jgi:hypothetical protein